MSFGIPPSAVPAIGIARIHEVIAIVRPSRNRCVTADVLRGFEGPSTCGAGDR